LERVFFYKGTEHPPPGGREGSEKWREASEVGVIQGSEDIDDKDRSIGLCSKAVLEEGDSIG
jgi:hypothetical protein